MTSRGVTHRSKLLGGVGPASNTGQVSAIARKNMGVAGSSVPSKPESAFVGAVLLFSLGGFAHLFTSPTGGNAPSESDIRQQLVWFLIYSVSAVLLVKRRAVTWSVLRGQLPIIVLVGLAVASTVWSVDKTLTFQRSMALVGCSVFALYVGLRFNLEQLVRILAIVLVGAAIGSVLLAIVAPSLGTDSTLRNAWRGLFVHKNVLGRMLTLATLVWIFLPLSGNRAFIRIPVLIGFGVVAALSQSVSSLVAIVVVGVAIAIGLTWRRSTHAFVLVLALVGAASPFILIKGSRELESIATALGRTTTLSGRTDIWWEVLTFVLDRPILGYGYSAFWSPNAEYSSLISSRVGFFVVHAHNGFLDLALELGLIGLTATIIALGSIFSRAKLIAKSRSERIYLMPIVFLVFAIVYNVPESSLLTRNSIYWILFVSISTMLSTELVGNRTPTKQAIAMGSTSSCVQVIGVQSTNGSKRIETQRRRLGNGREPLNV